MGNILSLTFNNTLGLLLRIMGNFFGRNNKKAIKPKEPDVESGKVDTSKESGPLESLFKRKGSKRDKKQKQNDVVTDGNIASKHNKSNKKSKAPDVPPTNKTSPNQESHNSSKFSYIPDSEFQHSNTTYNSETKNNEEVKFPTLDEKRMSTYDNVPDNIQVSIENQQHNQNQTFQTVRSIPAKSGSANIRLKERQSQLAKEAKHFRESKNHNYSTNYEGNSNTEKNKKVSDTNSRANPPQTTTEFDIHQSYNKNDSKPAFTVTTEKSEVHSGMSEKLADDHQSGQKFDNNKENREKTKSSPELVPNLPKNASLTKKSQKSQSPNQNINNRNSNNLDQINSAKNDSGSIPKTADNRKSTSDKNVVTSTTKLGTDKKSTNNENFEVGEVAEEDSTTELVAQDKNLQVFAENETGSDQYLGKTKAVMQISSIAGRKSIHDATNLVQPSLPSPKEPKKPEDPIKTDIIFQKPAEEKTEPILQQCEPIDIQNLTKISPEKQKSLDQVSEIKADAQKLSEEVDRFSGSEKDKQFIYLDEMLTRNLLKLDNVEIYGDKDLRQTRREAIKFSHQTLMKLRKKAEEYTEKKKKLDQDLKEAEDQNDDNVGNENQNDNPRNESKRTPTEKRKIKSESNLDENSKKCKQNGEKNVVEVMDVD